MSLTGRRVAQFFLEAFQGHGVKRGDTFAFYAGDIRVEGPHPFSSSGGNLGNGRTRTAMYTGSIEQLRGTAGARQVRVRSETALAAFTTPSSGGRIMFGKAGSCVFLSRPRCATLDVIFVEHALDDRVGRSPEPALGLRFGSAQGTAQRRRTADLDPIDADGDNRARADVGAAPQPAAATEFRPDPEIHMSHDRSQLRPVARCASNASSSPRR